MKPQLILKDGASVPQCYAVLPFHHGDYVVSNCWRQEGHEGDHECNHAQYERVDGQPSPQRVACGRKFPQWDAYCGEKEAQQ